MLLDKHSRFFVRHELKFRTPRDKGKPLSFLEHGTKIDVLNILETAVDNGSAIFPLQENDVVSLTKIETLKKEDMAVLLFRRSDPNAATPVFENIKTKKLRPADKRDDEAEAISAHLFINLDGKVKGPHPTHRAILEEVTGLGRSYVQALMHSVLREHSYPFRDERGETKETYTIPFFEGVPSETIGGALRGGGIKYVELVRPPKIKGLDVAGLVPHPERMRLTVKATSRKGILDVIGRIRDWAYSHDWKDLRVQVETDDERTRVVDIARDADAADVLFVHSERVNTEKPLAQCTESINGELVAHAQATFAEKWK